MSRVLRFVLLFRREEKDYLDKCLRVELIEFMRERMRSVSLSDRTIERICAMDSVKLSDILKVNLFFVRVQTRIMLTMMFI